MLPACLCFAPNSNLMLITLVARTWENYLFHVAFTCVIQAMDRSTVLGVEMLQLTHKEPDMGIHTCTTLCISQSLLNSRLIVEFACGLCEWSVTIPALKEIFKNYLVILRSPGIYRSRKHFPCSLGLMKQEWKFGRIIVSIKQWEHEVQASVWQPCWWRQKIMPEEFENGPSVSRPIRYKAQ